MRHSAIVVSAVLAVLWLAGSTCEASVQEPVRTGSGGFARGPAEFQLPSVVIPADPSPMPAPVELVTVAGPSDAELEQALLEGDVVSMKDIGTGVSRPKKVVLEHSGDKFKCAFKTIDKDRRQGPEVMRKQADYELSDNYRWDRAAYLLDRRLGLNMVPVTVIRRIKGKKGAAVAWISNAFDEKKRIAEHIQPANHGLFVRQRAIMRVFDALIQNTDRNLGNQLYTNDDCWRLHLIDHSRSFRMSTKLSAIFLARPARLPRSLYDELKSLEEKPLKALLKGLVSGRRVKSLLARRDLIVEKIDQDRQRLGDVAVFQDTASSPASLATANLGR